MITRRNALWLGAGMGLAALGAEAMKPQADPRNAMLVLDTLFPRAFAGWQVDDGAEAFVRPAREQARAYGIYDQVLERTYMAADGRRVMVVAAHGSEQSAGLQVHRPEVCYPGNGFRISDLHRTVLHLPGRDLPGTQMMAARPERPEPVTYWIVLGGEPVVDGLAFRLRQLRFGLRRRLLDGMLVRLSSIEPDAGRAFALHERFAGELCAALGPAERAHVFGA